MHVNWKGIKKKSDWHILSYSSISLQAESCQNYQSLVYDARVLISINATFSDVLYNDLRCKRLMSSGSKPLVQGCCKALADDECNDTNSETPGTDISIYLNISKDILLFVHHSFYLSQTILCSGHISGDVLSSFSRLSKLSSKVSITSTEIYINKFLSVCLSDIYKPHRISSLDIIY